MVAREDKGTVRFPVSIPPSVLRTATSLYTREALDKASQGHETLSVLMSIQIVITDGNPAKGEGGTSKNGDGGRGFVKITRGKSAALIEF